MPEDPPLLQASAIGKQFPGVRALHNVNLTLSQGEILSLVGENGAGKSTMMKILAGIHAPDEGAIELDGNLVRITNVREAQKYGIALIHQELNLSDNLDIAANIFLGNEPHKSGVIDRKRIHRESAQFLKRVGLEFPTDTLVADLTIGHQQLVEISKALSVDARIIIMDEPTSSLSQKESEKLFEVIRDLKSQGISIIYISHRLGEVINLSDRVVVLRDGENAGELVGGEITHDAMVKLMVGRDLSQFYNRTATTLGEKILEVKGLRTPPYPNNEISFSVRSGEILGIAGLVGAGRTELLQTIFGVTPAVGGMIKLKGKELMPKNSLDAIDSGIVLAPEDRKRHGLVLEMSVRENTSLARLRRDQKVGMIDFNNEAQLADKMIEELKIKTPHSDQVVQYLSGGNQQKVVLGKWLSMNPSLLLLDEPTRGIDIGSKQEIYKLMEELAASGVAVIFVSSEMEEVLGMADRVLVMHEGAITGELSREQLNEEAIMQLATGNKAAA
ncbi:MAG: sugar ABC transporter ATP-binding protein [Verrucomicrobiota bacterium]|nr:sugar ABC transporter ATP-binding protein [Verrucomicrobiota bacterium]